MARRLLTDHRLWLALVTLVAAYLRLWSLDTSQFQYDDEMIGVITTHLVKDGVWPPGVPASPYVMNGPIAPYVVAIPRLFSDSYLAMVGVIAAINVAIVPLFYLFVRNVSGVRAGLIAALLLAVNPWVVADSRRLWLNSLVVPTAVLWLWAANRALQSQRLGAWVAAGVSLAVSALLHLGNLPNAIAALAVLPFVRRLGWKSVATGIASFLLLVAPWVWNSLLPDLRSSGVTQDRGVLRYEWSSLDRASLLMTGVGYQALAGQAGRILNADAPPFNAIDVLAKGLAAAGWFWMLWRAGTERRTSVARSATFLVSCLMVLIPIVSLQVIVSRGIVVPNWWYFFNIVPPLLLGIADLVTRLPFRIGQVGRAFCLVIAAAQLLLAAPFFMTQREFWPLGFYGVPWKYLDEMVTQIRDRARADDSFVIVGGVDYEDWRQGERITSLVRPDLSRIRNFDGLDGLMFRRDARTLIYVTTNDEHTMTRLLADQIRAPQVFTQELPGSGWTRRIFETTPATIEAWAAANLGTATRSTEGKVSPGSVPVPSPQPARGGAAVTYNRARLFPPGAIGHGYRLVLQWQFDADQQEPMMSEYTLLSDGQEILSEQHFAYPAGYWQRGDWLDTQILNVFVLPDSFTARGDVSIRIRNFGVTTGNLVGEPIALNLGPARR